MIISKTFSSIYQRANQSNKKFRITKSIIEMFQVLSSINKNFYDVFCSMSIVRILEERVPTTVLLSCTPSRSLYALCSLLVLPALFGWKQLRATRRDGVICCCALVPYGRSTAEATSRSRSIHTNAAEAVSAIWRPLSIVKCNNERGTFVQSFLVWRSRRYHSESNGKKCLLKRSRRRRKSNISGTFYPWINCTFLHIRRIVSQCLCVCVEEEEEIEIKI